MSYKRTFFKIRHLVFLSFILSLPLVFFLMHPDMARPESKHIFPKIEKTDFTYFLPDQKKIADQDIYIFSSLSVVNLQRDLITFKVTPGKNSNTIPLVTFDRYPPNHSKIQLEHIDSTVWGQLETYFNKDIELIEYENEILSVLKELEEINNKYLTLRKKPSFQFNPNHTLTISKSNYFYNLSTTEQGKEEGSSKIDKNASTLSPTNKTKQQNLSPNSTRLKEELFKKITVYNDKALLRKISQPLMNDPLVSTKVISSSRSVWIEVFFDRVNALFIYALKNKIIALIAIIFILFLFKLVITILFRTR